MDNPDIEQRLASIEVELRVLRQMLYDLHEEDETDAGHAIRCAIETLNEQAGDLAELLEIREEAQWSPARARHADAPQPLLVRAA